MKKKSKILFHGIAVFVFLFGIVCAFVRSRGYEMMIFSKPALHILEIVFFISALLIEAAFIAVYGIKTKKSKCFLTYIIIVPFVFLLLFTLSMRISIMKNASVQKYKYDEFEKGIVVVNKSVLLSGISEIYETQNGVFIRKVTQIVGDDGLRPLEDDPKVKITVCKDGIDYFYYFGNNIRKHCFIKYENGSFYKKGE